MKKRKNSKTNYFIFPNRFSKIFFPKFLISFLFFLSFQVYKIKDKTSNEIYAAKRYSKRLLMTQPEDMKGIIKEEIEICRCLDSKHTIKMLEVQETQKSIYLIFEYMDGGSIVGEEKGYLAASTTKLEEIKRIIFSILTAIRYLKSKRIVHRDLKPCNIMFRGEDSKTEPVLIDFGLSCFVTAKTDMDIIPGTPGFIAPELFSMGKDTEDIRDRFLNTKIDIFSLGVIFHFYLFGSFVFGGATVEQTLDSNCKGEVILRKEEDMITDLQCPKAYSLLQEMLQTDPDLRISLNDALAHDFFDSIQTA